MRREEKRRELRFDLPADLYTFRSKVLRWKTLRKGKMGGWELMNNKTKMVGA